MSRPLVIYHANCQDGFCAAWVARKALGGEPEFVPAQYGGDTPDVGGRDVFVLDFSYKAPVLEELIARCRSLVVLDHHKTARDELEPLRAKYDTNEARVLIRFDMEKSGGRLTWEHFFDSRPAPWLVDYTEDRDLWRFDLPESRAVNAALFSHPLDFDTWDRLAEADPGQLVPEGRGILRYQDRLVGAIARNARDVVIAGHTVPAANTAVLFSEVAGKLAEGRPFGAAWFERADGKYQWSLRSRDGGVDVSEVARQFGGGGHRNAAGFEA